MFSSAFAQTAPAVAASAGTDIQSSLMSMLPLLLMFGYLGVEIANGVEVQMQRSAVVQVLPKGTFK